MGVCMFLTTLTFLLSLAPVNVTQEKLLETGFLRIAGDEEDYKPYVRGWYLSTCRPPLPAAPWLTTQIATAVSEKTSTIPLFALHLLCVLQRLNLYRYKGSSGIPTVEESTGKI